MERQRYVNPAADLVNFVEGRSTLPTPPPSPGWLGGKERYHGGIHGGKQVRPPIDGYISIVAQGTVAHISHVVSKEEDEIGIFGGEIVELDGNGRVIAVQRYYHTTLFIGDGSDGQDDRSRHDASNRRLVNKLRAAHDLAPLEPGKNRNEWLRHESSPTTKVK